MIDERRIRLDGIAYALSLRERWVAVPAAELAQFPSEGLWLHLRGAQGVFKPKELSEPLSIRSTLTSPYTDTILEGNQILYDFAPRTREYENDGLKRCAEYRLPLVYLLQLKGKPNPEYDVFAPVHVVDWNDATRQFLVDLSGQAPGELRPFAGAFQQIAQIQKGYVVTPVERRVHQAKFRNVILQVYRERCAVCVLRLRPLLDAAHVVPDREPTTTLTVNEGMALCATHHRAFDAKFLFYDQRYRVRIEIPKKSSIGEGERSMLLAFDGRQLTLPNDSALWPVIAE
jgi:putative restriction endonuclease